MIYHSTLYKSLQGEIIKTITYILNKVPIKAIAKTLHELWTDKKISLKYVYVWGCSIEAKPYKPSERNWT